MVHFKKMSSEEFKRYLHDAILKIAKEYALSGYYNEEEAMQVSKDAFTNYLPDGEKTTGQYIFNIINDSNVVVGIIWFGQIKADEVFIYDFVINEAYRHQGYGKQAMAQLEDYIKKIGLNKISLHVFGHNKAALSLYEKMGYTAFSINMSKTI